MQQATIIIISKNRHEILAATVAALQEHLAALPQNAAPEIIVVEEAVTPAPIDGVNYVHLPLRNYGFGYARQQALHQVKSEIVVFIDDDIRPGPGWLQRLLEPFAAPEIAAVSGAVIAAPQQLGLAAAALTLLGFPAGGLGRFTADKPALRSTDSTSSCNCAFRRQFIDAETDFDPCFIYGGEDTDFFRKLSRHGRIVETREAYVMHQQRERLGEIFRWGIRRGRAYFCTDIVSEKSFIRAMSGGLRRAFALKLLFLVAATVLNGIFAGAIAGAATLMFLVSIWGITTTATARRTLAAVIPPANDPQFQELLHKIKSFRLSTILPAVKFLIDLGECSGRIRMAGTYLYHRFIQPPRILTLHQLAASETATDPYTISYDHFKRLCCELRNKGYRLVTVSELATRLRKQPRSLFIAPLVALTFDDAYSGICAPLRELLQEGGRATVFAVTDALGGVDAWNAENNSNKLAVMTAAELRELHSLGAEVGSHTCSHVRLGTIDREMQTREISKSRETLSVIMQSPPAGIAYPYGSLKLDETPGIIAKAGYAWAVTSIPGRLHPNQNPYLLPRLTFRPNDDLQQMLRRARN